MGYVNQFGRIKWGEIGFDILFIFLLFVLFITIGALA